MGGTWEGVGLFSQLASDSIGKLCLLPGALDPTEPLGNIWSCTDLSGCANTGSLILFHVLGSVLPLVHHAGEVRAEREHPALQVDSWAWAEPRMDPGRTPG